ncbi:MAG: hypothetical protein CXZ00_05205 [Acidobacteria bacterium]|nr:MAG: hypothetical protein CXZ00_05205 [Acidobacteriota bacterium]
MDAKLRAELSALGIDMRERKALYVLAEICPGCGMVPLYTGHACGENWVREVCPACGKVMTESGNMLHLRNEPRCDCASSGCPFCAECCQRLSAATVGQLIEWPNKGAE